MHSIIETNLIRACTTLPRKQSCSKPETKLKCKCENIVILKQILDECIMLNEFKWIERIYFLFPMHISRCCERLHQVFLSVFCFEIFYSFNWLGKPPALVLCKYRAESSTSVIGRNVFISYARKILLCHGTNNIDLQIYHTINLMQNVFSLSPVSKLLG